MSTSYSLPTGGGGKIWMVNCTVVFSSSSQGENSGPGRPALISWLHSQAALPRRASRCQTNAVAGARTLGHVLHLSLCVPVVASLLLERHVLERGSQQACWLVAPLNPRTAHSLVCGCPTRGKDTSQASLPLRESKEVQTLGTSGIE